MTYTTKRCPYCGHAYQFMQTGDQLKYGCPLIMCAKCHKFFWDNDIKEPALYGYNNFYETKKEANQGCALIIYIPMTLLAFGIGVFGLIMKELVIGIGSLIFGGILSWVIVSFFKEKHDNNTVNRDSIIRIQQKEYDASMKRLQDTNYLTALAEHDTAAKTLLKARLNGWSEHYGTRPQ